MQRVKDSIIAFWLHLWLKRIAKRYPDFFRQMIEDVVDSDKAVTIMCCRYIHRMKFKEIPDIVNLEERQVYKIHQNVIKHIINL